MRISDLSRATGVPVPTVKYYLREGLLQSGELTSPNQARYGEEHLNRLRLVRILVEVGGLSIAAVRDVLAAVADEDVDVPRLVLGVQYAMVDTQPRPAPDWQAARADVDAYLVKLDWRIAQDAPTRNRLADVLHAIRTLRGEALPAAYCFGPYAALAKELAAFEIGLLPEPDAPRDQIVTEVTVGIAVYESALTTMRLLAEEDATTRRYGPPE